MEDKISLGLSSGDEGVIAHISSYYGNYIRSIIWNFIKDRDTIDDVFQEILIKLLGVVRKGTYSPDGNLKSFISMIARNASLDSYRRDKRHPERNGEEINALNLVVPDYETGETILFRKQLVQVVREAISMLPKRQETIVHMRIYEGLSFPEIAEETGIKKNTTISAMHYARTSLGKMIPKHFFTQMG